MNVLRKTRSVLVMIAACCFCGCAESSVATTVSNPCPRSNWVETATRSVNVFYVNGEQSPATILLNESMGVYCLPGLPPCPRGQCGSSLVPNTFSYVFQSL